MHRPPLLFAALFLACAPLAAHTQSQEPKSDKPAAQDEKTEKHDGARTADDVKETQSVTHHKLTLGGSEIAYTATAGTLLLREEDGKKQASVFYVAYTKEGVSDPATRPITFSFNGGPGSSSVWLHLGVLGPKRVFLNENGDALPPYHLVDNEFSILDVTDLVFIDPVSTGFSRAIPPEDAKHFHGVEED